MGREHEKGEASDGRMVVQVLKVGRRVYELRFNRCGRTNCGVCYPSPGEPPGRVGHGPYWYLCATRGRKWVRVYLGKVLNTEVYVTPEGEVDWVMVRADRETKRKMRESAKREEPDDGSAG